MHMKTDTAIMMERIPGKLTCFAEQRHAFYDVELDLMIRETWRKGGGLVATEIFKLGLADGSGVPDGGPYTLRYTFQGRLYVHAAMRVQHGKLIV